MTAPVDTPIYFQTIAETGLNPHTYPACVFQAAPPRNRAPRPGQKPNRKKK